MDKIRDFQISIGQLKEDMEMLMDYLKYQGNDVLHDSIREYVRCLENLLQAQENVLKIFTVINKAQNKSK